MLCPLEIGKVYRMCKGAYYDYAYRSGWHFKITRMEPPEFSRKWRAWAQWCKADGTPRKAYGNEISSFMADERITEYVQEAE